jgi:hypothetical protein
MKKNKLTRKQIIAEKEKLIIENFEKVSKQLGMICELSPELKYSAYQKSKEKYLDLPMGDTLGREKLIHQNRKFSNHIDPELVSAIQKLANNFTLDAKVEKTTKGPNNQYVSIFFNLGQKATKNDYLFVVNIDKNNYSIGYTKELILPDNFKRALLVLIKKIQAKELVNFDDTEQQA